MWISPDAIFISSFRLHEGSVRHTVCPASRHNSRKTFAILVTALAVPYSREQSVPASSANPTPEEQPYIGRANFLVVGEHRTPRLVEALEEVHKYTVTMPFGQFNIEHLNRVWRW